MLVKTNISLNIERLLIWYEKYKGLFYSNIFDTSAYHGKQEYNVLYEGTKFFGDSLQTIEEYPRDTNGDLYRPSLRGSRKLITNRDYVVPDPFYQGYGLETVQSFPGAHRAVVMGIVPPSGYHPHVDPPDRNYKMHVALETDSECVFIVDGKRVHIPVDGSVWVLDTNKTHAVEHFGTQPRVHLMWCMDKSTMRDYI